MKPALIFLSGYCTLSFLSLGQPWQIPPQTPASSCRILQTIFSQSCLVFINTLHIRRTKNAGSSREDGACKFTAISNMKIIWGEQTKMGVTIASTLETLNACVIHTTVQAKDCPKLPFVVTSAYQGRPPMQSRCLSACPLWATPALLWRLWQCLLGQRQKTRPCRGHNHTLGECLREHYRRMSAPSPPTYKCMKIGGQYTF